MAYFSDSSYGEDGRWVSGNLTASDTAGAIFNWTNIEEGAVIVDGVFVDVTTKTTSGCTLDVGYTATSTATSSDTLIDGQDINAATGVFSNIRSVGTGNAVGVVKVAKGKYITASKKTGAAAGLVGKWYLHYRKVRP